MTGRCLVSVRFYLVYRVGLVDKIFGLVDLVNKALGLVNKPKWHFEMARTLLMCGVLCRTRAVVAGRCDDATMTIQRIRRLDTTEHDGDTTDDD